MVQAAPAPAGYQFLTEGAGFINMSNRGRLLLTGADRQTFINGQVTNNVKDLRVGQGCYAALANAKGKMTSDLNIFVLANEILLDFEPGLTAKVIERLEKFIIADDVQIVDLSRSHRLLCVLGPKAIEKCSAFGWAVPEKPYEIYESADSCVAQTRRLGSPGVDMFDRVVEDNSLIKELRFDTPSVEAVETVRIERGIPRFGVDMDENTLVPEALGENAISYSKGCYIGQEVIARIRTYGQVAKALRAIHFDAAASVPKAGDKINHDGKEVGWITSAVFSPKFQRPVALGYVRKECNQPGVRLQINGAEAEIVALT